MSFDPFAKTKELTRDFENSFGLVGVGGLYHIFIVSDLTYYFPVYPLITLSIT